MKEFDFLIFSVINSLVEQWQVLDWTMIFFAKYLGYFLIVVFLILFLQNRNPEGVATRPYGAGKNFLIIPLVSALISRFIFTELIRFFYFRPRPFVEQAVAPLIEHAPTASFPSGHMAFFFALSAGVYAYNKKAGIWFFSASLLIGLARIFAGLHWPSDILGGAALGILTFFFVNLLKRTEFRRQ